MRKISSIIPFMLFVLIHITQAWIPSNHSRRNISTISRTAVMETKEKKDPSMEEKTEKYGLEVGLLESLKQKDGGESAKSLLKRYGIAYLATSIPLAMVSFTICYLLVDNGVDVKDLLSRIGIQGNDAGEKAGTFALAYAAHKAASPIRFPPTVILTPIVAKLIGKEPMNEENSDAV